MSDPRDKDKKAARFRSVINEVRALDAFSAARLLPSTADTFCDMQSSGGSEF